jgi:hypothetical protein
VAQRNGPVALFSQVPYFVQDLHPSAAGSTALHVYMTIARFADNTTRECDPAQKTIAEVSGLSANTVWRAVRELVASGAIAETRRPGRTTLFWLPRFPQDRQLSLLVPPPVGGQSPHQRRPN